MTDNAVAVPAVAMKAPTSPKGHFLLGHLPWMTRDPLGLFEAAMAHRPVAKLRFGVTPLLSMTMNVLQMPEDVHHVLVTGYKKYRRSALVERVRPIIGDGMIVSEGKRWLQQRKLAQPAFGRERIALAVKVMTNIAAQTADDWSRVPEGTPIDVVAEMNRVALRVIGQVMFGREMAEEAPIIAANLVIALEVLTKRLRQPFNLTFLPTAENRRFDRAVATLYEIVDRIIAERRAENVDRGDLLSMFMAAHDDETGARMSAEDLRSESMTMLLAGHETTGANMAWTFSLLANEPEVRRKMREEADAVLGDGPVTGANFRGLAYTLRVVKESLRLRPPVMMTGRTALEDDVLPSGVRIKKGELVTACMHTLHRDPAIWKDPDRFDPDRFTDEAVAARPKGAFVPFSDGPRRCIGDHFALTEATVVVATLNRLFDLSLPKGHVVTPQAGMTIRPKGALPMFIRRI